MMDTKIGCFMKPEVAMQRRRFSREFKLEAVKLVRERGLSAAQAARDLDVHENVLRKWVKEFSSSVKATSQTGRTLTALADAWHTHSLSRGIRPRDAKRWKGVVLRFKDWLFPPVGGAGFPCAADRPASA